MNIPYVVSLFMIGLGASLSTHGAYAQQYMEISAGYAYNFINGDYVSPVYENQQPAGGAYGTVMLGFGLADGIVLKGGLALVEKNYREERAAPFSAIYRRRGSLYAQVPVLAEALLWAGGRWGLSVHGGGFGAFWAHAREAGAIPNALDSRNTVDSDGTVTQNFTVARYEGAITLDGGRDNRFEFGLVAGACLRYALCQKWGLVGQAAYYHALTSPQKPKTDTSLANRTVVSALGIQYRLK